MPTNINTRIRCRSIHIWQTYIGFSQTQLYFVHQQSLTFINEAHHSPANLTHIRLELIVPHSHISGSNLYNSMRFCLHVEHVLPCMKRCYCPLLLHVSLLTTVFTTPLQYTYLIKYISEKPLKKPIDFNEILQSGTEQYGNTIF